MRRRMIIGGMVVLGVGYSAYKLTQTQVLEVEQNTGKKAEDLSEGELEGAMDELGIQAQEPTDEEIATLEAGNEPDEISATQAASQGTTDNSYLDELERLASFRDQGIINRKNLMLRKKIYLANYSELIELTSLGIEILAVAFIEE